MSNSDDKHGDHDLKAYLDGRDGVSAAYRQAAHEEPPATLDRLVLAAARKELKPAPATWYATRKPYALAASVMVAMAALSLYFGGLDAVVLQPQPAVLRPNEVETEELQLERAVEPQPAAAEAPETAAEATAANVAEAQDATAAGAAGAETQDATAADAADTEAFRTRALAPAAPAIGAGAVAPAPAPGRDDTTDAFARSTGAPAVVIDGPLLQQIEAEAAAAQAQGAAAQLEEIMVTGSRIVQRDDTPYRASREDWLVAMRGMVVELQRSSRLTAAQRTTAAIESELEREIELFLEQYPDTDIDAELGLSR